MKVFYKGDKYNSKVNFVDENNVFIGYDEYDDCCSDGGWFISDKKDDWLQESFKEQAMEIPGFIFDTKYFNEISHNEHTDSGGVVQFRLFKDSEEKFLTLYNCHNGYYGKGFDFKICDEIIKEGTL